MLDSVSEFCFIKMINAQKSIGTQHATIHTTEKLSQINGGNGKKQKRKGEEERKRGKISVDASCLYSEGLQCSPLSTCPTTMPYL